MERSTAKAIKEALEELSEEQRNVLYLHHIAGFGFEEISRMLDKNYNTVYSWYRRGCARMKRLLIKKGDFEYEKR